MARWQSGTWPTGVWAVRGHRINGSDHLPYLSKGKEQILKRQVHLLEQWYIHILKTLDLQSQPRNYSWGSMWVRLCIEVVEVQENRRGVREEDKLSSFQTTSKKKWSVEQLHCVVSGTTSFSSLKPLPEGKDRHPFYHRDALVFAFFNYSLKNASPFCPKTGLIVGIGARCVSFKGLEQKGR